MAQVDIPRLLNGKTETYQIAYFDTDCYVVTSSYDLSTNWESQLPLGL